jgi:hypothetical protein
MYSVDVKTSTEISIIELLCIDRPKFENIII